VGRARVAAAKEEAPTAAKERERAVGRGAVTKEAAAKVEATTAKIATARVEEATRAAKGATTQAALKALDLRVVAEQALPLGGAGPDRRAARAAQPVPGSAASALVEEWPAHAERAVLG
jgi:hypothetical protein